MTIPRPPTPTEQRLTFAQKRLALAHTVSQEQLDVIAHALGHVTIEAGPGYGHWTPAHLIAYWEGIVDVANRLVENEKRLAAEWADYIETSHHHSS